MEYVLYVGENCHDCKKVCKTVVEMQLDIPVKNIDQGDEAPFDLFILPALATTNGDLKAYGTDIIDFIKKSENAVPRITWFKRMMNFVRKYC